MTPVLISKDDVGSRREALENRFDGPIPARLLETRTAVELAQGHARAMIRFAQDRIPDLEKSADRWAARGFHAMAAANLASIADHRRDIAKHEATLARLQEETADVRHAAE